MTVKSYKLTGRMPVVGVDGVTRRTGTVDLEDETTYLDGVTQNGEPAVIEVAGTNIYALVQCGAIEMPAPVKAEAATKPKE